MSKNLSIRRARLEFRTRFIKAIDDFKTVALLCDVLQAPDSEKGTKILGSLFTSLPEDLIRHIFMFALGNSVADRNLIQVCWSPLVPPNNQATANFSIAVRKRPLWKDENPKFFDSMTIDPTRRRCILHDSRLDRSHQTFSYHREYALDGHFDEHSSNRHVFQQTVKPLLHRALKGSKATFCAFGQTGTGKTHTVYGMERAIAEALFKKGESSCSAEKQEEEGEEEGKEKEAVINQKSSEINTSDERMDDIAAILEDGQSFEVDVMIFEIRGKQCFDLLNDGCKVKLMHQEGDVKVMGARHVVATSSDELMQAFTAAHALRATKATERNAQSSRSHSITRLKFRKINDLKSTKVATKGKVTISPSAGAAEEAEEEADIDESELDASFKVGGELTLVDLAGSERNEDSQLFSAYAKEMAMESAAINASLMTLKECFRAMTEKVVEQEVVFQLRDLNGLLLSERVAPHQVGGSGLPFSETIARLEEDNPPGGGGGGGGIDIKGTVEKMVTRDKVGGSVKDMRMPFRDALLTTFLKDCFVNKDHRTVVVACVSPTPHDVEHSRRTLELVCSMRGTSDIMMKVTKVGASVTKKEISEIQPVNKWNEKRVSEWESTFNENLMDNLAKFEKELEMAKQQTEKSERANEETIATTTATALTAVSSAPVKARGKLKLPARCDGKALVRLTKLRLDRCCGNDKQVAELAFKSIRDEIARQNQAGVEKRKKMTDLLYGEARVKGQPIVMSMK